MQSASHSHNDAASQLSAHVGALAPAVLLNSIQDAVILTDVALRITGWNHAAEALYGWSAAEALGRLAHELLQTDYLGAERSQLLQQLQDQGVWRGELRHHHRDGRAILILATVTWMRGPGGEPLGALSLNRDISVESQPRLPVGEGLHPGEDVWGMPAPQQRRDTWRTDYERAFERLHILADASRAFAEVGDDYQALLDRIAQISAERLRAACSIRLLSDDGQWLDVAAIGHYNPAELTDMRASLTSWRIHIDDRAPVAVAARTGEPQFAPLIDREALPASLPPERQKILQRFYPHSLIITPLRLHSRSIGSLMLARSASDLPSFDTDDLSLAQDLTDRAALVIGNAQLLLRAQADLADRQRAQKVSELLYVASQLLARPLGQDEILNTLLDVLQQLIPFDSANIMLPDSANILRVRYMRGYETWTDPEVVKALSFDPRQRPSIDQIISTRRSLLIADTHQDAVWIPVLGVAYVGCWLGIPLIANNRVVGIFSIDRHEPNSLTADDVRLAEMLAASAAAAIERAQLIAQLRDERELLARRVEERTADLSLANAELTRASQAKSSFLASMSHELRTPLNAIIGFTGTLLMQLPGPLNEDQQRQLGTIQRSARHLLALINDILDLAKIESGKVDIRPEPVICQGILDEVAANLRHLAEQKGLALSVSYPPEPVVALADRRALSQILINLLNNAIKFTDVGEVALRVSGVGGQPAERGILFEVSDTGIGIRPEDQARLFQEFGRVDSEAVRGREGTGLGLRLSQRLAEQMSGRIAVRSEYGAGSTFSLTLPAR